MGFCDRVLRAGICRAFIAASGNPVLTGQSSPEPLRAGLAPPVARV